MNIQQACDAFRILLEEQQARIANANGEKKDFSKMNTITIGIIEGDGIGPLIMAQAEKVLRLLLVDEIADGKIILKKIDGLTIENRMALGTSVPENVLTEIKSCDVLLKGPTTTPMGGTMESANVTLRRELDLYANVRPVSIPKEGIDWVFYRENTEGEYVLGSRGGDLPGMAVDFKVTTDFGTRRIAKAAFDYAKQNGKTRVSIVTKANIMKKTDGKFRRFYSLFYRQQKSSNNFEPLRAIRVIKNYSWGLAFSSSKAARITLIISSRVSVLIGCAMSLYSPSAVFLLGIAIKYPSFPSITFMS